MSRERERERERERDIPVGTRFASWYGEKRDLHQMLVRICSDFRNFIESRINAVFVGVGFSRQEVLHALEASSMKFDVAVDLHMFMD